MNFDETVWDPVVLWVDGHPKGAVFYDASMITGRDFYRLPRWLFQVDNLTTDAAVLYAVLLDRLDLSKQNAARFSDEHNRIFVIYPRQDLMNLLGWGRERIASAAKCLTQANLMYERRRGQGKPSLLYLRTLLA